MHLCAVADPLGLQLHNHGYFSQGMNRRSKEVGYSVMFGNMADLHSTILPLLSLTCTVSYVWFSLLL